MVKLTLPIFVIFNFTLKEELLEDKFIKEIKKVKP